MGPKSNKLAGALNTLMPEYFFGIIEKCLKEINQYLSLKKTLDNIVMALRVFTLDKYIYTFF